MVSFSKILTEQVFFVFAKKLNFNYELHCRLVVSKPLQYEVPLQV